MRPYLFLIALLLFRETLTAQTSVVQDTKGETSLQLGSIGVVAINTKDESISFSYGIPLDKPVVEGAPLRKHFNYMGVAVKGKGKNGLINVIKNDEFQYDGSAGLFYFHDWDVGDKFNIQWNGSADFLFSQFKLYDSAATIPFSKQVYDKNSQGYKITVGVNATVKVGPANWVAGIALNAGRKNNSGDIKAVEVSNFYTQVDPATGQIRSIQKDKNSAYGINEYNNRLGYSNLNIDFGPQLFNQCLLLVHSRWSIQEMRKPQWNPAIGLYFTKANAPLEVVAGIQLQTLDWANTAESLKTRRERTTVNIVAGFSF